MRRLGNLLLPVLFVATLACGYQLVLACSQAYQAALRDEVVVGWAFAEAATATVP
jgi:hypothetical protein